MKSPFIKDITFPPPDLLTPDALKDVAYKVAPQCGSAAFWRYTATALHVKEGAQMWISKEVSDDLQASIIDEPDFESLEWPHDKLELVFEDPTLPTFLLQLGSRRSVVKSFMRYAKMDPERFFIDIKGSYPSGEDTLLVDVVAETPEHMLASVCYNFEDINAYARGDDPGEFEHSDSRNIDLEPEEKTALREMVLMAFKVLLFSASEGCKPDKTREAPTRKEGGKPGFKNRPKTDRFIVKYLPRHRAEKRKAAADEMKKHDFRGRHGHFRTYRHERYVAMLGVRVFIYPILGPDGTLPKRVFRVVKP